MKLKPNLFGLTLAALFALGSTAALAGQEDDTKNAQAALDIYKKTDPGLNKHLDDAVGYAIFPNIKKGAFVFGGAGGMGVLYEKGKAVGSVKLTQVTVGAQVGGQEFSELIIFKDQAALNDFKSGQFAFQAGASAVAAAEGVSASIRYTKGVAVLTNTKSGLMVEAALGGQKFDYTPYAAAPRT
jgi:lipid-binding SYLF domain-containing protein